MKQLQRRAFHWITITFSLIWMKVINHINGHLDNGCVSLVYKEKLIWYKEN